MMSVHTGSSEDTRLIVLSDHRLHERSHSVWPQLWKDRAEYINPLYKAELSQTQGVLRPNTTPYCFK